ncbi:MAG TPA: hypothetical protein VK119_11410 [Bacillota bacterium]|nr:hypothetical protein [Bacillota bacterium]
MHRKLLFQHQSNPYDAMNSDQPLSEPTVPTHLYAYNFSNDQRYVQSPFDQYAKPQLPETWYETMPQSYLNERHVPMVSQGRDHSVNFEQMDLEKILNTVGQITETYQRVSPIVKEIGALLKKRK